jgi:hypothetical protein
MLNYTRQPPDASWRIVPPPGAGFQSQLISRTTPILPSPGPAEFQSQAPPHAILKVEGNTNVPRSQPAVSPKQPDQPQMERQYRLATDDFDKLKSPPSKSYETNPIPFSNTWKTRERNLRNEPGPRPPVPRAHSRRLSNICEAHERDLRNEANFDPNPNKMKPLAPFVKRTQFSPGPRFPSPRTKLRAIAMPASQPL